MTLVAKLRVYSFVLACVCTSCGATLQEREARLQTEICYANAETTAFAEASKACPGDWESCEHRQRILDALAKAYEECP